MRDKIKQALWLLREVKAEVAQENTHLMGFEAEITLLLNAATDSMTVASSLIGRGE